MAVTAHVYASAPLALAQKLMNLQTDTLKAMLCTSAYTPSQTTHARKSDVTGEVNGTGYTAGGVALTNVTVVQNGATVGVDCDDVTWQNSTLTARYAVFYDDAPTGDANKPLLCYWDFGADTSSATAPFTLTIASSGLVAFQVV